MKKLFVLLLTLLLLVSNQAFAQFESISFGAKGGINLSDLSEGYNTRLKYQLGVTVDYEFTPNFYILSGLSYQAKGGKRKMKDGERAGLPAHSITVDPGYLQIPMHLGCKFSLGGNTRLVFSSGTYVAIGVNGKSKVSYGKDGVKITEETDYFRSGGASRFDMGLGLGLGIELDRLGFGIGYDYGLLNNKQIDGVKAKNRNVALTVSYKL